MSDYKSNTEHLHAAGVVNKADLTEENIKAIDSLSNDEVEHLKKIGSKISDKSGEPVGIAL